MFLKKNFFLCLLISVVSILEVKSKDLTNHAFVKTCQHRRLTKYGQVLEEKRFQDFFTQVQELPPENRLRTALIEISNTVDKNVERVARAEVYFQKDKAFLTQMELWEDQQVKLEAEVDRLVMCEMAGIDKEHYVEYQRVLYLAFQKLNNFLLVVIDEYNKRLKLIQKVLEILRANNPTKAGQPGTSSSSGLPSGSHSPVQPGTSNVLPPLSNTFGTPPENSRSNSPVQPGTSNGTPPLSNTFVITPENSRPNSPTQPGSPNGTPPLSNLFLTPDNSRSNSPQNSRPNSPVQPSNTPINQNVQHQNVNHHPPNYRPINKG